MKIIQLIQKPQLRGAEVFASQLGNHLIDAGHHVRLVSIFNGDANPPFKGKFYKLDRPLNKRLWDWQGWKMLAKIIDDEEIDIVQANAGDTLKFAVSSRFFFRWKARIVFRNANKISDFIDTKSKYLFNNAFVKRVDHVISVSDLCREDFIKTFHFSADKVTTGFIGVEKTDVPSLPADLQPVFAKGPVLVNVGSLVPEKNHTGLLRIFSQVLQSIPNAQLVIIGRGRLGDALAEQVTALNITGHVHFLGNRKDVLAIMKAAKVFVMPSHIEGLPAVILEAMYCKTPVVAYDVGGISEVVQNNVTGWLIEKNDEQHFAKTAISLLNESIQPAPVVGRAFDNVITRFDNIRLAGHFAAVYQRVLDH